MITAGVKNRLLLFFVGFVFLPALVHAGDVPGNRNRCRSHHLFGEARLAMKRGRWTDASERLQEAVQLAPDEPSLYRSLARCYMATDRLSAAVEAAATAARLDDRNYASWLMVAELERVQGQIRLATSSLERAYACQDLREQPDLFLEVAKELAGRHADAGELAAARHIALSWAEVAEASENKNAAGEAYETLARLLIRGNQFASAVEEYSRAREAYRATDPARFHRIEFELAELCLRQHQAVKALEYLQDYLDTQPAGPEPYELYIAALRAAGHGRELPDALTKWIQKDKHNLALQLLYARELVTANRDKEAEELYLLLSAESATPEIFTELFRLYIRTRREKSALAMLDRSIDEASRGLGSTLGARAMMGALADTDLARQLIPPALHDASLKPATRIFLARVAIKAACWDAAERWLMETLQSPGDGPSEANLYECLLRILWGERKLDRIIEVCRKGLANSQLTNRLLFHENLTRALAATNHFEEALAEAERAIAISPREFRLELRLLRIEILRLGDRLQQAESECLAILDEATDPESEKRGRVVLAGIYTSQQNYQEAEEQLLRTLHADPENAGANNDLGYLWADQGKNLAQAEVMIRRAIASDAQKRSATRDAPTTAPNGAFIDSLGWVLYRQGRLKEALKELEQAVALSEGKRDPVVADHLAEVYFQLGCRKDARRWWLQALAEYKEEGSRRRGDAYDELEHKLELLDLESAKPMR